MEELAGRRAERADRSSDEDVATGHVPGLAGDLRPASGELAGLVRDPERGEADAVGPERRGLDDVGARREVFAVDRADQVRARGDEFVEASPLRDPAREQERAHRAVAEQRPVAQPFLEPRPRLHARTIADDRRRRGSDDDATGHGAAIEPVP